MLVVAALHGNASKKCRLWSGCARTPSKRLPSRTLLAAVSAGASKLKTDRRSLFLISGLFARVMTQLVGNRPEMMPLDFHLFNDWPVGAHDAIIKTSHLPAGPPDHPSKYGRYRGTGLAGRRRLRSLRRSSMRGSIIPQDGALCKM